MRGALIVLLMVLSFDTVVLATDIDAVKQYWFSAHRTPPPDTAVAEPLLGIEPVPAWPLVRSFLHHRLYSFREGTTAHSSYAVVAVDDGGTVTLLHDVDAFNAVLAAEHVNVSGPEKAADVAETFLRIRFFNGIKLWGWDLGINAIESLEDIKWPRGDSTEQKRAGVATIPLSPPRIDTCGDDYCYTAFSWSPVSGDLQRVEVVVGRDGIVRFEVGTLAQRVGEYGGY